MKTAEEIQAQIDIIESLFDRGLKDSFQTLSTGKRLYDDVINPTIKDLKEQLKHASQKQQWIPVSERPLITLDTKGNWTCTVDGDRGFIAAVPLSDDNWWIRHCVIEDRIGLCIVGDIDNEPAGYDILDITHWQPLPPKPKQ